MRHCCLILLSLGVLFAPLKSIAYEVDTHEALSAAAAKKSTLGIDPLILKDLGLAPSIEDSRNQFPNSEGKPTNILNLIKNGARFEDTLTLIRPSNHFYNPLNGAPLTKAGIALGSTSPDWALEDQGEITGTFGLGKQEFSYRDARQYFLDALTLPDKMDRGVSFGKTFQTIGHIVHHIQDMAQPQHVRNDIHLDFPIQIIPNIPGVENPSTYEKYTNLPEVLGLLSADFSLIGYDLSATKFVDTFNQPRKFWASTTGAGLAQFTNANFVSAGTNFDNSGMFNFPLFTPSLRTDIDIQQMCTNAKPACPNPNLSGKMTFYGNWVEDRFTGSKSLNPYASTRSIFDADLEKINAKKSFSLNRFNFGVMHGFLIPRAVAYSTGLINYFFRGKIDFLEDKNIPGNHVIKNLSPEDMHGSFTLYYDAEDGNRYPVAGDAMDKTWAYLAILKNGEVDNLSFSPPTNPAPKEPGRYILVFNGDLGEEKAIPGVTPGAIAAKEVGLSEPDFYIAPSAPESYGRLGRYTSEGNLLEVRSIETHGFVAGIMVYGQDIFHVDSSAAKNGVVFHTQKAAFNDIAGNGKEIFVVTSDGYVDPVVSVYDFDGRFLRAFSILPQYAYQGGFVQLVAYGSKLVSSANFTMSIYDTAGSSLLTLDLGQNVYESVLAVSKDRIYRANFREQDVQVYDFSGALKGSISVPGPAKITCMDATESKLYVVTSDSVGYRPYGGRIHIFSRRATDDTYHLINEIAIPYDLDSWHHACSVDRESEQAQPN